MLNYLVKHLPSDHSVTFSLGITSNCLIKFLNQRKFVPGNVNLANLPRLEML